MIINRIEPIIKENWKYLHLNHETGYLLLTGDDYYVPEPIKRWRVYLETFADANALLDEVTPFAQQMLDNLAYFEAKNQISKLCRKTFVDAGKPYY